VSGGDLVGFPLPHQPGKPRMAKLAGRRLQAQLVLPRMARRIARPGMELQGVARRQLPHELLVGVALRSANAVIEVSHREHNAQLIAEFQKDTQQRHRIRSPGDGGGDPLPRPEQSVLPDKFHHLLLHVHISLHAPQPRRFLSELLYFSPLMKVIAILPAAGLGTRMAPAGKKGAPSKQFFEIEGAPILIHTLRVFARNRQVTHIIVALRGNEMERFSKLLAREKLGAKVDLVEGGEHRQQSVANALASARAAADDIVLVHDAVRPFVDDTIIASVIAQVEKHGAAIAGLPAVDTIKQVDRTADGAIITSTIPRERVVQAQTPQGFRYQLIKRAFDSAAQDGFTGTDEASLVERLGESVSVVMGSPRNIKITTPADLELAGFFLQKR